MNPLRQRRDYESNAIEDKDLIDQVFKAHLSKLALKGVRVSLNDVITGRHKLAITMNDLSNKTNYFSHKNAPRCTASLFRTESNRQRWMFRVKCNETDSEKRGHMVRIKATPGKSGFLKDRDVLVTCSCPGFLYYGGLYNAQNEGYWEDRGPSVKAPTIMKHLKNDFYVCKHIFMSMEKAKGFVAPVESEDKGRGG